MSTFVFPDFEKDSEEARLIASVTGLLRSPELADRSSRGWLVACSGGADSCALLLLAAQAGGLRLEVACVDHGLREGAAGDVAFVADLSTALGLPFHTARLSLPGAHVGENELRDARYAWFAKWQGERDLGGVLLGHTLDDQAETLLLHLIRGTGPRGLGGMSAVDGDRVRPLLSWRKAQLQAFLSVCGVRWREDETNAGDRYLRNRVRHGILEAMARENPRVVEALAQTAELVRLEHDALVELAERELATRTIRLPGVLESWPLMRLLRWPAGVQTIILRRWWRLLSAERGELRAAAVREAQHTLATTGVGAWDWPGPVRLMADRGLLVLCRPAAAEQALGTLTVTKDGDGDGADSNLPSGSPNSNVRFVRPGDRLLRPDGTFVRCKKLLEEVPRGLRPFALVVTDGRDRVVWLQYGPAPPAGFRIRVFAGAMEIPSDV